MPVVECCCDIFIWYDLVAFLSVLMYSGRVWLRELSSLSCAAWLTFSTDCLRAVIARVREWPSGWMRSGAAMCCDETPSTDCW